MERKESQQDKQSLSPQRKLEKVKSNMEARSRQVSTPMRLDLAQITFREHTAAGQQYIWERDDKAKTLLTPFQIAMLSE